jgi:DNA-binding transcriptional MerR regulator
MTAAAPAKAPPKETWRDLMPVEAPEVKPENLFTREDISRTLDRYGIRVTPSDLRYWENRGILPRSIRQWHSGAVRAVYPYWYLNLVVNLRRMQDAGYTLAQIKRRLRAHADVLVGKELQDIFYDLDPPITDLKSFEEYKAWEPVHIPTHDRVTGPDELGLTYQTLWGLMRLARQHERFTGVPSTRVDITIVDEEGKGTTYSYPVKPTDSQT